MGVGVGVGGGGAFLLEFYGRFDNRQPHKRSISLISFRSESFGRLQQPAVTCYAIINLQRCRLQIITAAEHDSNSIRIKWKHTHTQMRCH